LVVLMGDYFTFHHCLSHSRVSQLMPCKKRINQ
jgi:hypothetical protein